MHLSRSFRCLTRLCLPFIVLLSGCSIFYTPGFSELETLCAKDGGMPVYQRIEAEGYFNGWHKRCNGCWDWIVLTGFDYLEFENINARRADAISEKGMWRLSKETKGSEACHRGIQKDLDRKRNSKVDGPFVSKFCIKAEKITQPKSRYFLSSQKQSWQVNDFYDSTIDRIETILHDRVKNSIAVKKVQYLLNPWPNSTLDYGKVFSCLHTNNNIEYLRVISPLK